MDLARESTDIRLLCQRVCSLRPPGERRLLVCSLRPAPHCSAGQGGALSSEEARRELPGPWAPCGFRASPCDRYSWPHVRQLHFGKSPRVLVHRTAGKTTAPGPHERHSWKTSPPSLLPLPELFVLCRVRGGGGGGRDSLLYLSNVCRINSEEEFPFSPPPRELRWSEQWKQQTKGLRAPLHIPDPLAKERGRGRRSHPHTLLPRPLSPTLPTGTTQQDACTAVSLASQKRNKPVEDRGLHLHRIHMVLKHLLPRRVLTALHHCRGAGTAHTLRGLDSHTFTLDSSSPRSFLG